MGAILFKGKPYVGSSMAEDIVYDNTDSELSATDVNGAIDEVSNKTFILTNKSLTFSNLVATVSDARVTASTYAMVYFTDATLSAAANAGIVVDTSSGTITFTATTAPTTTLVCDIVCRKG